jgi:hypothetical protein
MRFKFFTHLPTSVCASRMLELRTARILAGTQPVKKAIVVDEASEFGVRLHQHGASPWPWMNPRLKGTLERYRGGTLVSGSIGWDASVWVICYGSTLCAILLFFTARYVILNRIYHGHFPHSEPTPARILWLAIPIYFGVLIFGGKKRKRLVEQPLEDFLRRNLEAEEEMR